MTESYSLSYLLHHVKRSLAINYQDPIWVIAEIAQVSFNKGNIYLNLIEKNEKNNELTAKTEATLWKSKLKNNDIESIFEIFKIGNKILIKCIPEFHEIFGLKLNIEDFDAQFTIGLLQLELEKTRLKLKKELLWEINKQKKLPLILKNIAIISSSTAAGYLDFMHQLANNIYGYQFKTTTFESSVQGDAAKIELINSLNAINNSDSKFDCIIIVRGGGAKMDLQVFNDFEVCKQICLSNYPVLVGIGHEIDETISDEVANKSLKTPTAVAEYIIQHNLNFETNFQEVYLQINQTIKNRFHMILQQFEQIATGIQWKLKNIVQNKNFEFELLTKNIQNQFNAQLIHKQQQLLIIEEKFQQYNWRKNLENGYFIIENSHKRLITIKDINLEQEIKIISNDGEQLYKIEKSSN